MEVELVSLGTVPLGLVSSILLYGAGSGGEQAEAPLSRAGEVLVSLCSSGKLIAFIASYKAQFVACEDHPSVEGGEVVSYLTSFEGLLHVVRDPTKQRPHATAVVTIPIAFEARPGTPQHSSIVVVGFSDGFIRAYSKSGVSVLSQLLHAEPVVKITCMASSMGPRKTAAGQSNLVVLFKSAVCVVEGGNLVEVVRANVARWSKGGAEEQEGNPPLLIYRKWCLLGQTSTTDVTLLAQSTPSSYDYLCEASSEGGCDVIIRGGPAPEARLIAVGEQPMIALYRISKDAGTPNMSELLSAVASKMTSAVLGRLSQAGGWLGWRGAAPPRASSPEEKMPVASNLQMSTSVPDSRRSIATIVVSPLGNLAAAVDCFGRVLLVDCETLIIRRMWKGYRDAQCGWLLVNETPPPSPARSKKRETVGVAERKAQCLCIYASRRGIVECIPGSRDTLAILEHYRDEHTADTNPLVRVSWDPEILWPSWNSTRLWPVQHGCRVAAFQVGKGCRLLYSPHGVFVSDSDLKLLEGVSGRRKSRGLKDTAVLLCPNGQMVTFSVPFPTLARVSDTSSHDAHLLQKLPHALNAGDTELVLQIASNIKSSQSMKKVVDILINSHPLQDVPSDFTIKVLNLALSRVDPSHQQLFHYIAGVRQLAQLLLEMEDLSSQDDHTPPSYNKLNEHLTELCGVPSELSKSLSDVLRKYFVAFTPKKRVIKNVGLKDLSSCFDLPEKVGNYILSHEAGGSEVLSGPVFLNLKNTLSETALLDIGCELFLALVSKDVPEYDISNLFQKCGIPVKTLLSLPCRVFLNGNLQESNPSVLLQRMHRMITVITKLSEPPVEQQEAEMWSEVGLQCAHTHNAGHALLIALLCQKISSGTDSGSQTREEEEAWETVTAERERWIRLIHHLEVLTLLSNTIRQENMRRLPPAPFVVCEMEDGGTEIPDISVLEVHLLHKVEKGGVSAAMLEANGPALIAHCVSQWLVENQVPAEIIAQLFHDAHTDHEEDGGHRKVVFQLGPLLKLLPHTLSYISLLLHCAWQAAYRCRDSPEKYCHLHHFVLQYISEIPHIQLVKGIVGFLWHHLFEGSIVHLLDSLKRGTVARRPVAEEIISVCRNLMGFLYQMTYLSTELDSEEQPADSTQDVLVLPKPRGRRFLVDIVLAFPVPGNAVVKTYFELLLFTEIALQIKSAVNVVAFFPTWVRGALKKGTFLVTEPRLEQIPLQLQQKRVKFLCEAVSLCLGSSGLNMVTVNSVALKQHTSGAVPNVEVSELGDLIFLLAELWELNSDNIKRHWVLNLFASGHGDHGREVFLGISDKSKVSQELLSLAGCIADHLIHQIDVKSEKLALIAQIPPSLLEWLRNQSSGSVAKACARMDPTWKSLAQLLTLIQPYLTKTHASSVVQELNKVIRIKYS